MALLRTAAILSVLFCFAIDGQSQRAAERRMAPLRAIITPADAAALSATGETAQPKPPPLMRVPSNLPVPPGTARPLPEIPVAQPPPAPLVPSPAPVANFEALGDDNTEIPPDTQGAAGPNHLMVTLNTQVRIEDKTGTVLSTVSLGSFWNSTGAIGVFDPRVAYDPFAGRWIFSAASNGTSAASSILVGVSRTSDPTGPWNLYREDADSTDVSWADYPQLGFNKDWIVVTVNMYAIAGGAFEGSKVWVFGKANLYAGNAATETIFADNDTAPTPAATYDNVLATLYLARNWNGNSNGTGFLRVSSVTGAVGSETYTAAGPFVQIASVWDMGPPNDEDFAPQSGTAQKIQNGDDRLMNLVYRNGYLWTAQNVFLPSGNPARTAAQWWQFSPDGTVIQFGRVDDPTGTVFYAYPTIAVNRQNDVLLGYSTFSANQFASAGYSLRSAGDTASTLRSSTLLKAGQAAYFKTFGGVGNRWGDYSNTVVDPANDLDFWTIQEYAASPKFPNNDDRWGTWWGKVLPPRKKGGQITSQ
jgi:hypothetical protein